MTDTQGVASWRIILAFVLDLITAFFAFGFLVAYLVGGMTEDGFALDGWRALLLFALIIAYFAFSRHFGGRLWQRILGAVRS